MATLGGSHRASASRGPAENLEDGGVIRVGAVETGSQEADPKQETSAGPLRPERGASRASLPAESEGVDGAWHTGTPIDFSRITPGLGDT